MIHIEVAVPVPIEGTFTYSVPESLSESALPGKRVLAPFGKREIIGYILRETTPDDRYQIKAISDISDEPPVFPASMIPLFEWISDYYLYPIGKVIECALPDMPFKKNQATEKQRKKSPKSRDPLGEPVESDIPPMLTSEQEQVVASVTESLGQGFSGWLLAGVTGSGKTEVYLRLAQEVIGRGLSVIVLVPEIALISQTERRFRARFGECVAVLHSGLTPKERRIQWQKIVRKEVSIAVGPRSAVFSPFDNIGLIIVDEEHDGSYKQENDLLYNARDIALVRAKFCECPALLGSATPSVQTYYNACIGKLTELKLSSRVEERPMPRIHIADLRKIRDFRGIRRFITPELHQKMSKALSEGNQILLFLNRRGFAAFPVCAECGAALKCEHCDISMTLHKSDNAYKCHFCGFTRSSKSLCPTCGSANIKFLGLGTERVEESVKTLFPEARIARMDRDTTSKKGALLDILKDLKHQKIDILIGTQMVAKGHDFPKITLVGIICADLTLNLPDFRAGEQTFQLLAQVAGRAGRGDQPGQVILQTYAPNHFTVLSAQEQDFRLFYDREIESRRALQYPPFSRLIQIRISGQDSEKVQEFAAALGSLSKEIRKSNASFQVITVLGPAESPISRIEGKYRWQMLLKSTSSKLLHDFCRQLMAKKTALAHHREIRMTADVDPLFMA